MVAMNHLNRIEQSIAESEEGRPLIKENIHQSSFRSLKRNAAPGVGGMTWQEYEAGLEGRLADLHSRLHRGAHRALLSRRVYIEKADGRQRPLGIAARKIPLTKRPPQWRSNSSKIGWV
jgi:RNA-directed DNA polymerase